jgi:hypothetical protein
VIEREDGVIADQAWAWSPGWQERIRAGLDDLASGRSERFESGKEVLAALESRPTR